jgi:GNAT superfamily N-acetyltransferase
MAESKDEIKIRKMTEDDLTAVHYVDNSIIGKGRVTSWPYSFDAYWDIYHPDVNFIAELNGQVVGFLSGIIEKEERSKSLVNMPHRMHRRDAKIGWIEVMGVKPEAWHKGIGTRMIDAFQSECKKNEAVMRIVLRHDDHNLREFFRSIGFEPPKFITLEKEA